MGYYDICNLVATHYTQDIIGQEIPTEFAHEVYCEVFSITGQEFSSMGRNGITPELKLEMFYYDYHNESIVEYHGIRYGVYRTYRPNTDKIELYLERKEGIYESTRRAC